MHINWITDDWSIIVHAVITAVILLAFMVLFVRIIGLRSFAKMSSIDFVTTITIGSVMGAVIMTNDSSVLRGAIVIAVLLTMQMLFSRWKMKSERFADISENQPLLLMSDGEFIEENLKKSNVSKSDVIAKLREANAIDLSKVFGVILENTGDISVLHGEKRPDPSSIIYDNVKMHA